MILSYKCRLIKDKTLEQGYLEVCFTVDTKPTKKIEKKLLNYPFSGKIFSKKN